MTHYDIAIIGTGSGNSILDERYEDKSVAICEQGVFGGTCLNVGCLPTKMFVYAAEVAQIARDSPRFGVDARVDGVRWPDIVSRIFGRIDPLALGGENYRRASPNVTVYDRHTRFGPVSEDGRYTLYVDGGEEFTAEQVVIAAGSRVRVPPAIAESGVPYYTSDTIMRIHELPEHLVIVGGGFVAAEFAHVFSALGSKVCTTSPRAWASATPSARSTVKVTACTVSRMRVGYPPVSGASGPIRASSSAPTAAAAASVASCSGRWPPATAQQRLSSAKELRSRGCARR